MRAFLALNLTQEVRDHLEDLQYEIKLTNRGKGTYSKPDNLHMSLAFLDEITRDQAEVLMRLLRGRLSKVRGFDLTLSKLGYFSDESSATVWCSVRPDNNLKSLVSTVYQTVRDAKIHFDSKPFKAHITLGRKINIMNVRLSDLEVRELSFPVESVTLFKSTLTPDGPIYQVIDEIDLI